MNFLDLLAHNSPNIVTLVLVVFYLQARLHWLEVNMRKELAALAVNSRKGAATVETGLRSVFLSGERGPRSEIGKLPDRRSRLAGQLSPVYVAQGPPSEFPA